MAVALFSHAFRETLRFTRLLPWLVVSALLFLLARNWPSLSTGATASDAYVAVTGIGVVRVLALAAAILTTAVIGQEVEQRTIVYILTRSAPRWMILLVRFAASTITIFAITALATFAVSLGSYGLSGNPFLGRDLLVIALGSFAYGSLFLFISLLVNRPMIWCILFAFGWETAVPNMPGDIYKASILTQLQAIMNHPKRSEGGSGFLQRIISPTPLSATTAVISLAILTVVLLALSTWWFTKFEYVPREDAE